ncbi:MAG: CPBP family intramembrane metalloprotease [Williamsia sp.]|nr:CPBP family intramembrane metalloprotease [Williamsia sp.]
MSPFLSYFRDFSKTVHAGLLIFSVLFTALLVFLNYRFSIEQRIVHHSPNLLVRFASLYVVYLAAFAVPYIVLFLLKGKAFFEWKLLFLVLLSPAVFALKVVFNPFSSFIQELAGGAWGRYWAIVTRLPLKCLLVTILLSFIWKAAGYRSNLMNMLSGTASWKPYFFMLLLMVPLISWASFQEGFLQVYPKLQQVGFINPLTQNRWLYKLLFELSYGTDFLTIELFFRGFLVLAFVRYAGQDAIVPMAVFYCSIHFGKPLAECISSFFGGLLLGIVVYNTRSIAGGLIVHLGIAWMMEAGGQIGHMVMTKITDS